MIQKHTKNTNDFFKTVLNYICEQLGEKNEKWTDYFSVSGFLKIYRSHLEQQRKLIPSYNNES